MSRDNYSSDDVFVDRIDSVRFDLEGATFTADVRCLWKSGKSDAWLSWSLLQDPEFDVPECLISLFKESVLKDIRENPSMWPDKNV